MCLAAISVGPVYFKNIDLFGPVCVCMPPGVNPSTDPCQPSSHLTLSGNDNPPKSLFCSHNPPTTIRTCSDVATTCVSAEVMLFLART